MVLSDVVDGLDECVDREKLAEVLRDQFANLPPYVRFWMTCRSVLVSGPLDIAKEIGCVGGSLAWQCAAEAKRSECSGTDLT